jgi:hypothetical protein
MPFSVTPVSSISKTRALNNPEAMSFVVHEPALIDETARVRLDS